MFPAGESAIPFSDKNQIFGRVFRADAATNALRLRGGRMGNSSPNARKPAWHKGHAGFVFFSYYSQIKSARKIDEVTMSSRPKRSESEAAWRDLETGQYAAGSNMFLKDPSTSFRSRSTPLGMTGAFYFFSCYFNLSIVVLERESYDCRYFPLTNRTETNIIQIETRTCVLIIV